MQSGMNIAWIIYTSCLLIVAAGQHTNPDGNVPRSEGVTALTVVHSPSCAGKDVRNTTSYESITNCSQTSWLDNCTCPEDDLGGVVECKCDTKKQSCHIELLTCHCMTEDKTSTFAVVGLCAYGCFRGSKGDFYFNLQDNGSILDEKMCGNLNRTGQMCGQCENNTAPPVYSYHLNCVNCSEHYQRNPIWYALYSLLPVTGFFLIVITFRISAYSAKMNAFIVFSQILTAPVQLRVIVACSMELTKGTRFAAYSILSMYAIWNLDFFRLFVEPFCLHPQVTTLQVLALDYTVALYPFLLVFVGYFLVELHEKFSIVVWLWRPFHRISARFRRQCDIRTSLVDAFATFLSLSCVRLLNVSFDLLASTRLHDATGKRWPKFYLYYDGTVEFFGPDHLLYGILAISVLFLFIIIPVLVLCLYSCRCCRRYLNVYRLDFPALQMFMDMFQGNYKDGTNGTRDCRYFSAVYLILRFVLYICYAVTLTEYFYVLGTVVFICVAMLIVAVRPYKSPFYNVVDTLLILMLALGYLLGGIATNVAQAQSFQFQKISAALAILLALVPLAYITGILLHWTFVQQKWAQKTRTKVRHVYIWVLGTSRTGTSDTVESGSLGETTALLSDPTARDEE